MISTSLETTELQLDESGLEKFLHSAGVPPIIRSFYGNLPEKIETPVRSILDCGGGDGLYMDMLLDRFSEAEGTLIDSASYMLERNVPRARKHLVCGNLEDMSEWLPSEKIFDLICFSDVLHHCIARRYSKTREIQTRILDNAVSRLAPGGHVLVCERLMNSFLGDEFTTRSIYHLTRSKLFAGFVRGMGANTAGVGVCFFSDKRLRRLFRDVGLEIDDEVSHSQYRRMSPKLRMLGMQSSLHAIFLLRKIEGGR